MKLKFFYLAHRNASRYFDWLPTEGYFSLLKRMVETSIVDSVDIYIESPQKLDPVKYAPGITGYAVPGIENAPVDGKDVVWVRGGWKSWFPRLKQLSEDGHKLLLYAANTGRGKWTFWDVIFDDLAGKDFVDIAGRVHVDFRKPTNPDIFRPMDMERKFDLCIGASHIHDKKGQWRGVEAALWYQKIYGKNLRCIMPGSIRRGVKTNNILEIIEKNGLNVETPGMVPRNKLVEILNSSKVFGHFGSGGQGDRGVIEAMRCGCPVMIGFPPYHAPWTYESDLSYIVAGRDHPPTLAKEIRTQVELSTEEKRKKVFAYHEAECGLETVILPRMRRLFSVIEDQPNAYIRAFLGGVSGEN